MNGRSSARCGMASLQESMMIERFDPDTLAPPQANYSHGAFVPKGSDILFVAGQLGISPQGKLGADFAEQAELAFKNVAAVLKRKGMTPADLVKIQMYMLDVNNRNGLEKIIKSVFGDAKPVSTLLVVKSLARPEFLFEVDAVAAK
jgi:2-iminobutanoate/2-iminopropanoate deaminase